MRLDFKSLPELLDYFKEESTCKEFLASMRWSDKPACPHCGCEGAYVLEGGKRYKCKNGCGKKFSVTVGTVFENTKIPLRVWFAAIYLATSHKKGISSVQLAKDVGVTQKTAWFVLHRIREMFKIKAPQMLSGTVQVDETFVGGKNKNRHADKKVKYSQGRSYKDKTPVFGMISNGQAMTQVVPNTQGKTLRPIIMSRVKKGSTLITDDWLAYNGLSVHYNHKIVDHSKKQYQTDDGYNTNSIEGFWSIFKRGIIGIYHYTSSKHLQRYADEFTYRYNTRDLEERERFVSSFEHIQGRLTYRQLTAA